VCRFGKGVAPDFYLEPAAPPFVVLERWESMLRAGMGVGRALGIKVKVKSVGQECPTHTV